MDSRKEQLGRWYLNKDVKDLEELAMEGGAEMQ